MKDGICPKCNSRVLIKNKPMLVLYNDFNLLHFIFSFGRKKGPLGWLLGNDRYKANIHAWVCGECGYTELYTTNFKEVLIVERKVQERQNA